MSRTKLLMLSLLAILALFTFAPMALSQEPPAAGQPATVNVNTHQGRPLRAQPTQMRVVSLKYALANEVASILQKLGRHGMSGMPITVVADARTNSVLLSATEDDLKRLTHIIATLDREVPRKKQRTVEIEVIIVENRQAHSVGRVISELYARDAARGRPGRGWTSSAVRIVVDNELNAIVAQASPESMKDVKSLIAKLDVPVK